MSNAVDEFDEWIKNSILSIETFNQGQDQLETTNLSWISSLDHDMDSSFSINDEYGNIMEYFSNLTNELTVLMLHPTVVQKSYQNEKRFMSPQPLIYFIGDGWPMIQSQVSVTISDSVKNRLSYCGQLVQENGRVDLMTETSYLRSFKGIKMNYYKASFKSLYVSEVDKLKSIHLDFKLDVGQRRTKLSFQSKEIKIISKPSKKKFLVKTNDFAIVSGSMVAFFNRVKCQSISTRYLGFCSKLESFVGRSNVFDAFLIWNVQDPRSPKFTNDSLGSLIEGEILSSQEFVTSDPKYWTLKYGQVVRLQHVQSGFLSKPFVLCRVADKNWIEYNLWAGESSEPFSLVSQLHRIALMALSMSDDFEFLSIEQESVTLRHCLRCEISKNAGHCELEEGSIWTLCSIDQTEISFYIPKSKDLSLLSLGKFPHVFSMNKISDTQASIFGVNLNANIQVYFGMIKVFNIIRHSSAYWILNFPVEKPDADHDYPLLLVDQEGIIFKTGFRL